ncbi:MAG: TetR/AcrR family transcriptional regulator [Calditrichae bacterium]|nr:TetR/AcrR family transcriptional regulator [Calditrichota bacterium]MCB9058095.1 TetR/AcrR family transcriptional regulator [Calditrichia bacterium]
MSSPIADQEELTIQNAAIELFAKKGFNASTVVDIAEKAHVSRQSIYHHFSNKKQILVSLLENIWQRLADEMYELSKNSELDPLEKIDVMVDQTIDIFTDNPHLALVFFNEHNPVIRGDNDSLNAHYVNYLKAFALVFEHGLQKDFINPHIDGRVFLFFVHGGLRCLLNEWAMHPDLFPIEKVRESIKYQIKHGILKW